MKSSSGLASRRFLAIPFLAVVFAALSFAQHSDVRQFPAQMRTAPQPLITQPIDESHLAILKGNTHPLARREFDLGTAPATLPMQRMLLVLKRSREQESALRKLLDDQQDKSSSSYHKWLTPDEFGKQFGPTDTDIQTVTGWLQSHGFQVGTTRGRAVLEFSGSASQVKEAFHTTIHKYIVNEEQHWANASDPLIPAALTPAVTGVLTLHNFLKKPQLHLVKEPVPARIIPGKKPQVTFPAQNGQPTLHALGPQDYSVIYNINPVYNNGNTGQGVTIGVVGRSNLYNGGEDIGDFRTYAFGLCCGAFNIVLNGPDPGELSGGDEEEATLDSTWSGALATGASVDLVVSATTNTTDGVDLSESYIVENNLANIMTESFSSCELFATDAQLAFTYGLAEQAAAQGITYFVSAGDNGSEGCDDPSLPPATNPVSVSFLASTPFNVAVGGTMFNENGQNSKYWGTEPPAGESAISYIPENVWNESGPTAGLWSGSGGASSGNIQGGGTTPGVPKPSWQSLVPGIPDDNVRDLPDVSLTAATHDPYLVCLFGSCFPDSQGGIFIYFVGGTSASAPAFASIMALVDQSQAASRQGQANYTFYRLAATQSTYPSQCNGSDTSTPPATTCIFNDVTVGNNVVPGEQGTLYQATPGYNQTTGLGSVNVANLVTNWSPGNLTTTTLILNPVTITHGQSVNVNIAVTSASGTPTGDVSLLAANQTAVQAYTLSGTSTVVSSTSQLPGGGPYNVTAHYAGDATNAPSESVPVSVTVGPEASTTNISVLTFDANGNQSNFTGGPFGSFVYLRADVAGISRSGIPTGSITFDDNNTPITNASGLALNSQGNTATPNGILNFDTGTHSISASYFGDSSFNPSSSTAPITFTIQPGFYAAIALNQAGIGISTPGGSGSTSLTTATSTGFSGTISFSCSGLPAGAACSFSPASVVATGTPVTVPGTVTVSTKGASAMLRSRPRYFANSLFFCGFMAFGIFLIGAPKARLMPRLLLLLALMAVVPACGGGSGNSTPPPPPNVTTPAGTYNVLVNATSGSMTSTTGFTLFVR